MQKQASLSSSKAPAELALYFPIADSIARLFYPYAEVVVHELGTDRIVAIYNNLSQREIGDPSLLAEDDIRIGGNTLLFGPYEKRNPDGSRMKAVSALLRNAAYEPIGLLCVNLNLEVFDSVYQRLRGFLDPSVFTPQPDALFRVDWQERINQSVHARLVAQQRSLEALSRSEKKELVVWLKEQGAFAPKGAATYIGRVLGMSRASVYKALAHNKKTTNE